jgi:DNA-binding transcriptional regulator YhcF (GntR family)
MKNYLKIVKIDNESLKPKYIQLAEAITEGVDAELIVNGDILPSIHDFCVALDVSKNTIEKAYNTLKKQGIVASYRGKGYFIFKDKVRQQA